MCTHETLSKWVAGGVLKSGMYVWINQCAFVDLFVDYLYQPVHFETHVDIGGVKVGAGLGVEILARVWISKGFIAIFAYPRCFLPGLLRVIRYEKFVLKPS